MPDPRGFAARSSPKPRLERSRPELAAVRRGVKLVDSSAEEGRFLCVDAGHVFVFISPMRSAVQTAHQHLIAGEDEEIRLVVSSSIADVEYLAGKG